MKVSVIILTRDRIQKLRKAYESVCRQTRQPDEIIIVDDFSETPVAYDCVQDLNTKGIDTRILRVPDSKQRVFPPQRGRNFGARNSSCDVLMFLDDDDRFEADKIETQLRFFNGDNAEFVYTGKKVVRENRPEKIIIRIRPKATGNIYPDILLQNLIGAPSGIAVTRELFDRVGGFDELIPAWDDWDFYVRCAMETHIRHDGRCGILYSVPFGDLSQYKKTKFERRVKAYAYFVDKYRAEIKALPASKRRALYSNCNFSIAKALRKEGIAQCLPYIMKAFFWKPRFKPLFLFLPVPVLMFYAGDLH